MGDDEHTPPRGGALRNTGAYSHLNDRALLERMADKATQAYTIARRVETKVDVALAGKHPWYERYGLAALVVIFSIWFVAWSTRSSATVPEPSPRVQAAR